MLGLDNPIHILFLLMLLLLVFGAKRLPEMGRSLGTGLRGFKDSLTGEERPALTATGTATSDPQPATIPGAAPAANPGAETAAGTVAASGARSDADLSAGAPRA